MDASIIVATIALVASLSTAALSIYGQFRSNEIQARREAQATLHRYREPLVAAAYDLQSRLYNILQKRFLEKYYVSGNDKQRDYAVKNTLYLVGQYFAWTEILRRRIQFLDFGQVAETREVAWLLEAIQELYASDSEQLGKPFMVWRGEQRAIGEQMIVEGGDDLMCMGYAAFVAQDERTLWRWLEPLARDVETISRVPNDRLRQLHHALIDLIERLDSGQVRFPKQIIRA